jgi:hypothetical protein
LVGQRGKSLSASGLFHKLTDFVEILVSQRIVPSASGDFSQPENSPISQWRFKTAREEFHQPREILFSQIIVPSDKGDSHR